MMHTNGPTKQDERAVLAATLAVEGRDLPALENLARLDAGMFSVEPYCRICEAVLHLHRRGEARSPEAVVRTLRNRFDAEHGDEVARLAEMEIDPASVDMSLRRLQVRVLMEDLGRMQDDPIDSSDPMQFVAETARRFTMAPEAADPEDKREPILLADLMKGMDHLEPEAQLPDLVWAERLSLLHAREKEGKSTLTMGAIAAASRGGEWFEKPVRQRVVLLLCLEDHPQDMVSRAVKFGVDTHQVHVVRSVTEPLPDLHRAIEKVKPDVVVIDTLAKFAAPLGLDPTSSVDWTDLVGGIADLARTTGAGILVTHHSSKKKGEARDSTAISASADVVIRMKEERDGSRHLESRGRIETRDLFLRLVEDEEWRYELTLKSFPMAERLVRFVRATPGVSKSTIRKEVPGSSEEIDRVLGALLEEGVVADHGDHRRSEYFVPVT